MKIREQWTVEIYSGIRSNIGCYVVRTHFSAVCDWSNNIPEKISTPSEFTGKGRCNIFLNEKFYLNNKRIKVCKTSSITLQYFEF